MKNIEKISPSDKIIEKLKEKKFWKKFFILISWKDVIYLCLNYKFLASCYSKWTVESKNPI